MNSKRMRVIWCLVGCAGIAAVLCAALLAPRTNRRGVETVLLSRPSGFYGEPFYLELSSGTGRIYYTLDSSDPDESAMPYEGPILISDASAQPNVYSEIPEVSLELIPERMEEGGQSKRFGFSLPEQPVDKATVVRAVEIDDEGNRSDITTGVYFVGYGEKTGYANMGVIAVTTDPDNLFDYDTGIYVLGEAFDGYLKDGKVRPTDTLFEFWPANYRHRGIAWERPAHVCCFDADRNLQFSGDYGIRIQGKFSRGLAEKSLNVFARDSYGASGIPGKELFDMNVRLDSLNLNTGANGVHIKIHDALVNELVGDLDIETRPYKPYQLFLDGEYWGVYWMTPRCEKEYLEYKYGVRGDNIVSIKVGDLEIGEGDEDLNLYRQMVAFIADGDMSDPELYARACELIDIESCLDYYAVEIYVANVDWPDSNTGLWRAREVKHGEYADGKWRWILFDVNMSMYTDQAQADFIQSTANRDPLFASLMDSEAFSSALYGRLVELAENQFNPARVETWVRDYEVFMTDAMEKEYERFYNGERTAKDFINGCERIITFFRQRCAYVMEHYAG